jgi:hypothetical protein
MRASFINQLTSAINDGSFLSSLQTVASTVFTADIATSADDLAVSSVTVVVIIRPTQSPTSVPVLDEASADSKASSSELNPMVVAGGAVGGFLFICLLGFCISRAFCSNSALKAKDQTNKIVPVELDISDKDYDSTVSNAVTVKPRRLRFLDVSGLTPTHEQVEASEVERDENEVKSANSSYRSTNHKVHHGQHRTAHYNRPHQTKQLHGSANDEENEDDLDGTDFPDHGARELSKPMRLESFNW